MSIKLIACDLDGTLMAADHITVTQRTYNTLFRAHETGVKLAIATGRTLNFTDDVTAQIPFVDYVIYSNGACVYDRAAKKNIYTNCIPAAQTSEILELLSGFDMYYNAYHGGMVYVQENKIRHYKNHDLPQAFLEQFIRCSNVCEDMKKELDGKEAEIVAMYSVSDEDKKLLVEKFESMHLHITSSLVDEFEVTASNVNKGTAIKGLCEAIGISTSDAMAFGDAMNDYEMICAVGHPYAMGNACDELKRVAKNITLTNAEDGVAVAVEKKLGL